jgi:hypothetical protein
LFVVAERSSPVERLVRVTDVFGTTAPAGSVTLPSIDPADDWARTDVCPITSIRKTIAAINIRNALLFPRDPSPLLFFTLSIPASSVSLQNASQFKTSSMVAVNTNVLEN